MHLRTSGGLETKRNTPSDRFPVGAPARPAHARKSAKSPREMDFAMDWLRLLARARRHVTRSDRDVFEQRVRGHRPGAAPLGFVICRPLGSSDWVVRPRPLPLALASPMFEQTACESPSLLVGTAVVSLRWHASVYVVHRGHVRVLVPLVVNGAPPLVAPLSCESAHRPLPPLKGALRAHTDISLIASRTGVECQRSVTPQTGLVVEVKFRACGHVAPPPPFDQGIL